MVAGNTFGAQNATPGVQLQRSGKIIRGDGQPNPMVGHPGNLYLDTDARRMYLKRVSSGESFDPWGSWVWEFPAPGFDEIFFAAKWYGDSRPSPSLGVDGDLFIMFNCDNPTLCPRVFGPKENGRWPEDGTGDETCALSELLGATPVGLMDESAPVAIDYSEPVTFIGLVNESEWYVMEPMQCFTPTGLQTWGTKICGTLNANWNTDPGEAADAAIAAVIEQAGLTPDPTDPGQLADAIKALAAMPVIALTP